MNKQGPEKFLRSIPVPPPGTEEHYAFKAIEQVLNYALNVHLGNLSSKGFLSKNGERASTGWVNDRPGAMLQLKFNTMDQILLNFTPNLMEISRKFYLDILPGQYQDRKDLNSKVIPEELLEPTKVELYNTLLCYAQHQVADYLRKAQPSNFFGEIIRLRNPLKARRKHERLSRLMELTKDVPLHTAGGELNRDDVNFLNKAARAFRDKEKEDPYFFYVMEILNGLAFLVKDHRDFQDGGWELKPYNAVTSLRNKQAP